MRNMTFEQLVQENKEKLLNDKVAMDQIEKRWELKRIAQNEGI